MHASTIRLAGVAPLLIRDVAPSDIGEMTAINNATYPSMNVLDAPQMRALVALSAYARVACDGAGVAALLKGMYTKRTLMLCRALSV